MATAMTNILSTFRNRALLRLSGEGVLAFLHNILTCNVAQLGDGQTVYGALLSAQGKILHDVFVTNSGDNIWIDCAAKGRDDLISKLRLYRLRAKFEIEAVPENSIGTVNDPRHPSLGLRAETNDYDEARFALGIADSAEIGSGKLFPHEANFDQLGAVNFEKGCYIGQEVVSRMQHRSTARSRILPIIFDSVQATDENVITSGEMAIGEVLGRKGNLGIGLVRLDRLAVAAAPLTVAGNRIHANKPDWIKYEVIIPKVAA